MVMYLANAFFIDPSVSNPDPRVNRVSVPAPVDPATPSVAWWYDKFANLCPALRNIGFDRILTPPLCKTQSGHLPTGTGYGVRDHYDLGSKFQQGSLETRFGTREQLQRFIACAHASGIDIIADMVLHQMAGGRAGVYSNPGASPVFPTGPGSVLKGGAQGLGRFPKQQGCFRGGGITNPIPPFVPQDAVPAPGDDIPFGDEACYQNSQPPRYMIDGVKGWAPWLLRATGIDGLRVDDTKGLWPPFLRELLNSRPLEAVWAFNEYFDGLADTLQWYCHHEMNGRMSQLDFSAHWAIKDVCDYGHSMWRWLPQNAYAGRDPQRSVTFVDSPDTDLSPGQQVISNKMLGYAAILLLWEGLPMVYYRDHSTDQGCYGLGPKGIDNLVWCHNHLIGGQSAVRHVDSNVIAIERLGFQVGKPGAVSAVSNDPINHRGIWVQTAFGANRHLHDYTGHSGDVWTDANGWAHITIPSNFFGTGNSYVCYAPAGVADGPRPGPKATTQWFEGAPDLDLPPIMGGKQMIGRVWCGAGTDISGGLSVTLPPAATMGMIVADGDHNVLSRLPVDETGVVSFPPASPQRWMTSNNGWIEFVADVVGVLSPAAAYRLRVTYTGTEGLHRTGG